ncbi:MAG TPA: hypothetical protein VGD17_04790, partial [Chitinophagaceae bacterium]
PDSIVSEKGNVWIYKYRHQTQKDSVALFVYSPTNKGKKYPGFSVNAGSASGQALEVVFDDKLKTGKSVRKPITNGIIRTDVSEVPKLLLYSER